VVKFYPCLQHAYSVTLDLYLIKQHTSVIAVRTIVDITITVHPLHISVVLELITYQRPCPCSTVCVIWSLTDFFLDSLWQNFTGLGFNLSDL